MRACILCIAALTLLSGCEHLEEAVTRLYYRGFGTGEMATEIMRSYEGKMRKPTPSLPFTLAPPGLDVG